MKRIFLIFIAGLLISTSLFAQKRKTSTINWLSIAIKGGYGGSLLMNQNIFSDKKVTPNFMNGSYFFGGRIGWTLGDYIGVSFETDFSTFGQEFDVFDGSVNFNKITKISSMDLIPMLRFTATTGFYAELGPKFSTLKSITETPTLDAALFPGGLTNVYNEKYTSAILGIGFYYLFVERITLSLGFRANYGWKSMVSNSSYYSVTDDGRYFPDTPYTNSTVNLIQLQGVLELNYFFGFFGDASCGKGRLMLFK